MDKYIYIFYEYSDNFSLRLEPAISGSNYRALQKDSIAYHSVFHAHGLTDY